MWGRLLAERLRRRWESQLLAFVASAAIRPPRANGRRRKSRERERRALLPRQESRFGDGLPAGLGTVRTRFHGLCFARFWFGAGRHIFLARCHSFSFNSRLHWFRVALGVLLRSRRACNIPKLDGTDRSHVAFDMRPSERNYRSQMTALGFGQPQHVYDGL